MDQTTIQEIIEIWKKKSGSITKFGDIEDLPLKTILKHQASGDIHHQGQNEQGAGVVIGKSWKFYIVALTKSSRGLNALRVGVEAFRENLKKHGL